MVNNFSRRDFLKFLGVNLGIGTFYLSGCSKLIDRFDLKSHFKFEDIGVNTKDELVLPKGFSYDIIRSWKDPINPEEFFGTNNDYIAFFELTKDKALLWVNHEGIDTKLIPNYQDQRLAVGGSVIAIEKNNGKWQYSNDKKLQQEYNCRYDANTPVAYSGAAAFILGEYKGTLANCSGGVTPWNTVLTCEENYNFFPEKYNWKDFDDRYYGWVVEINPYAKHSKPIKHTALGRFAHENAATILSKNKKMVVYMADDTCDEHLYKYVSRDSYQGEKRASHLLEYGNLYVAKFDEDKKIGTWELLDISDLRLSKVFASQGELLINTRKAAKIVNATPLNRPEDIEISPYDGSVFIAQTQNPAKNDFHGSILKLKEKDNDYEALEYNYEYFIEGGQEASLSCPDNLCFDNKGNLWVATDIYGLYDSPFEYHGNNALYVIPLTGKEAGIPKRFASCPIGAEITGPCFSPDYKTLFLAIQHPGEVGESTWPNGFEPRSSVVAINLN